MLPSTEKIEKTYDNYIIYVDVHSG